MCHRPPGSCPGCLSPLLTPHLLIGELHTGFYKASTVYLLFVLFFLLIFLKRAFSLMEDGLSEAGTDLDTVSFPAGLAQAHSGYPTKGCRIQAIKHMGMRCRVRGCVRVCVTPWTVTLQSPLSVGFSRQECWSGVPCPPLGDHLLRWQAGSSPLAPF